MLAILLGSPFPFSCIMLEESHMYSCVGFVYLAKDHPLKCLHRCCIQAFEGNCVKRVTTRKCSSQTTQKQQTPLLPPWWSLYNHAFFRKQKRSYLYLSETLLKGTFFSRRELKGIRKIREGKKRTDQKILRVGKENTGFRVPRGNRLICSQRIQTRRQTPERAYWSEQHRYKEASCLDLLWCYCPAHVKMWKRIPHQQNLSHTTSQHTLFTMKNCRFSCRRRSRALFG
jgi:hypothetical protein